MTAKEIPILFSPDMANAIYNGKDMTRRGINRLIGFGRITEFSKSDTPGYDFCFRDKEMRLHDLTRAQVLECCPYGKHGDFLWGRENGWERPHRTPATMREGADTWPPYIYDADGFEKDELKREGWKRRPSIHMPRWASRILLEVTEVRIERLQDISHGDALSEGVLNYTDWMTPEYKEQCETARITGTEPPLGFSPPQRFQHLWDSINGPSAWDANPFVWVISFRRIDLEPQET